MCTPVLTSFALAAALLMWGRQAPSFVPQLTSGPLKFGVFDARFLADGTFTLEGRGWPAFRGTWKWAVHADAACI
jgi:hypothetical protein